METGTKYRMPLTVIGMAVEKSSISRSAGAEQAALWTRFHFPRKHRQYAGLERRADLFSDGFKPTNSSPCFARELESPIVTDRLNGLSLSCATNFGNRIFHRLQRIVFATFENDTDYDFDSDSMGIVFFVFFLLLVASLSTRTIVSTVGFLEKRCFGMIKFRVDSRTTIDEIIGF